MTSSVTCGYSGAAWEVNAAGQDACKQYAALVGTCNPSFTVTPVTPASPPYTPTSNNAACQCNVVAYNLQAACGWCQEAIQQSWWSTEASWAGNCTAISQTYIPNGLPPTVTTQGLVIPAWATATVNSFDETWNPSRASQIAVAASITATGRTTTTNRNTYTGYSYSYPSYTYNTNYPYDPYNLGGYVAASTSAVAVAVGVTFGIWALTAIIVVVVYLMRQKRRKAFYGPMGQYYRENGVGGGPGYGAPLLFKNEPNVHGSPALGGGHASLPSHSPAPSSNPQAYTPYQPPSTSGPGSGYGGGGPHDAYGGYTTPYGGTPAPYGGAAPQSDPRQSYVPPQVGGGGGGGGGGGYDYPPPTAGTNPFNTPHPTPGGGPPPGAAGAHGYSGHAEVY